MSVSFFKGKISSVPDDKLPDEAIESGSERGKSGDQQAAAPWESVEQSSVIQSSIYQPISGLPTDY